MSISAIHFGKEKPSVGWFSSYDLDKAGILTILDGNVYFYTTDLEVIGSSLWAIRDDLHPNTIIYGPRNICIDVTKIKTLCIAGVKMTSWDAITGRTLYCADNGIPNINTRYGARIPCSVRISNGEATSKDLVYQTRADLFRNFQILYEESRNMIHADYLALTYTGRKYHRKTVYGNHTGKCTCLIAIVYHPDIKPCLYENVAFINNLSNVYSLSLCRNGTELISYSADYIHALEIAATKFTAEYTFRLVYGQSPVLEYQAGILKGISITVQELYDYLLCGESLQVPFFKV